MDALAWDVLEPHEVCGFLKLCPEPPVSQVSSDQFKEKQMALNKMNKLFHSFPKFELRN